MTQGMLYAPHVTVRIIWLEKPPRHSKMFLKAQEQEKTNSKKLEIAQDLPKRRKKVPESSKCALKSAKT